MPAFGLLTGTQEHSHGGLPTLPLVNLFAERAVTEPTGFALQSRPVLQRYLTNALGGATAIRALTYAEDATLGGLYAVYSTTFKENSGGTTTTLSGSVIPSIAWNQIGVVATAGGSSKWWNGSSFQTVSFPDTANVTKVIEHQGRFLFLRAGTHRLYWTEPYSNMLSGGNIVVDALAFVSAEDEPDWALDMVQWGGRIAVGGRKTIELFTATGSETAAYAPLVGSAVSRGVFATGAMTVWDNQLCWVTPERSIYRWPGGQADKLSNSGIEEKLRSYLGIAMTSFTFDGREFLHVWETDASGTPENGSNADLLLDASTGEWCEWETGGGAFDGGPSTVLTDEDYPIFGAKSDSRILGMSYRATLPGGSWTADNTIEHRFRFGVPIDGGSLPIHNVLLRCTSFSGAGNETVSLRFSRDRGQTWSSWLERSITDPLRKKVEWRSLGMFDQPGILCEVKTAGVGGTEEFMISGAYFNEFVAGRGRT